MAPEIVWIPLLWACDKPERNYGGGSHVEEEAQHRAARKQGWARYTHQRHASGTHFFQPDPVS